ADGGGRERSVGAHREDLRRVRHGGEELAVLPADRDRLVAPGQRLVDEAGDRSVDHAIAEIDELEPDLAGKGPYELGLGDGPGFDEETAERLPRARLFGDSGVELRVGEQ